MFNNKTDNETDFCESYKSQILGSNVDERKTSSSMFTKLIIILFLLALIIGISFYGYSYLMHNQKVNNISTPPISTQGFDEDLVVEDETPEKELVKEILLKEEAIIIIPKVEKAPTVESIQPKETVKNTAFDELDIEQIANNVKIEIAKSETEAEKNEKIVKIEKLKSNETVLELSSESIAKIEEESLEIPTATPAEAQYLEELADLSKEIDKERK